MVVAGWWGVGVGGLGWVRTAGGGGVGGDVACRSSILPRSIFLNSFFMSFKPAFIALTVSFVSTSVSFVNPIWSMLNCCCCVLSLCASYLPRRRAREL